MSATPALSSYAAHVILFSDAMRDCGEATKSRTNSLLMKYFFFFGDRCQRRNALIGLGVVTRYHGHGCFENSFDMCIFQRINAHVDFHGRATNCN